MKTSRTRRLKGTLRRVVRRKLHDVSREAMALGEEEGKREVDLLLQLLLMETGVDKAVANLHRHRRREVNVKRKDYSDVSYFFLDVDYMEDNPAGS